jgi:hypothetical protein
MAQMALEKSTHEPLRRLAQKIAKEQETEAKKFETWLPKSSSLWKSLLAQFLSGPKNRVDIIPQGGIQWR